MYGRLLLVGGRFQNRFNGAIRRHYPLIRNFGFCRLIDTWYISFHKGRKTILNKRKADDMLTGFRLSEHWIFFLFRSVGPSSPTPFIWRRNDSRQLRLMLDSFRATTEPSVPLKCYTHPRPRTYFQADCSRSYYNKGDGKHAWTRLRSGYTMRHYSGWVHICPPRVAIRWPPTKI